MVNENKYSEELIDAAEKTFNFAHKIIGISEFDEWCELVRAVTDGFLLQQIQATTSPKKTGIALKHLADTLKDLNNFDGSMDKIMKVADLSKEQSDKMIEKFKKEAEEMGNQV